MLWKVKFEVIPENNFTKRHQVCTVPTIRRSPRIVSRSKFLKPSWHDNTGKLWFRILRDGRTGLGCLANPDSGLNLNIWQLIDTSSIAREINQLTLFISLEVFPLIGLDNAASLSCESSSNSSLKFKLIPVSKSPWRLGALSESFCFPFTDRPLPLFFFEIKFPALVAMLCEAVVRVVTVPVAASAWDFEFGRDSETANEPESVVCFLPTVVPDLGWESILEVGSSKD